MLRSCEKLARMHSGKLLKEICHYLGYSAVLYVYEPKFRRNISPPSSGYKISRARNKREQLANQMKICNNIVPEAHMKSVLVSSFLRLYLDSCNAQRSCGRQCLVLFHCMTSVSYIKDYHAAVQQIIALHPFAFS
jgi:hypothetical protein